MTDHDHNIGDVFTLNGVRLSVEQESDDYYCYNTQGVSCFFRREGKCCGRLAETGDCRPRYRRDHKPIVFIEQRKED